MVQLHGTGPRATPPPPNFAALHHHDDDTDENGYVSLNRNGAEYYQDGRDDQSDQWVDEDTDAVPRLASSSRAAQPGSPLRKRRRAPRGPSVGTRTPRATSYPPQQVAQGPLPSRPAVADASRRQSRNATPVPAPAPPPRTPSPPLPPLELPSRRRALRHTIVFVGWLCDYAMSIVRPAVRYLRYPLIAILFLFLVATLLNRVAATLSSAFSPVCYTPGFGFLPMCKWVARMNAPPAGPPGAQAKVKWADYPGLVEVQSRTFEQLVDDSLASGSSASALSLHIKKAEMATGDLIALVRLSDLHSKDSLAETLTEFILDGKIAERSLHRLDAKVNGAVDRYVGNIKLCLSFD